MRKKQRYNWGYNYICDWYFLRAKFMNDWNLFVREVGRGRGVQERSLEVTEVSRQDGRRWCRHEAGLDIFWKKDLESLSRLSFSELRLVTNKRLGYDMPRVKLKMICTDGVIARHWSSYLSTSVQKVDTAARSGGSHDNIPIVDGHSSAAFCASDRWAPNGAQRSSAWQTYTVQCTVVTHHPRRLGCHRPTASIFLQQAYFKVH